MRLLLDTHAFLWFVTASPKLSAEAEGVIRASGNQLLLSVASVWETAIKQNLGRLPIPEPLDSFIPAHLRTNRITLLPIQLRHTFAVSRLPLHHRDPFDRLLVAQAISESIPVVSADGAFDAYPVQRLW
ncbi:MAG TPA: type II toxin-antitoxin system VapC family toxin [Longimicrobium sp.]|jgi:PIN domain nuclease of toxin-antitoxin system